MVESIGKKLLQARQARGLTLEEAAMETRIRATQLAALEADDYSSFPNNTYARGFLIMYGKFLNVDARAFARELETGSPISVSDYQYLNANRDEDDDRSSSRKSSGSNRNRSDERRRPSLVPLIVFVVMLGIVGFGSYLYMEARRLEAATSGSPGSATPAPELAAAATPAPAVIPATPAPVPMVPASTAAVTITRPIVPVAPTPAPTTPAPPAGAANRSTVPTVVVPATPVPTFRTDPPTFGMATPPQNELEVEPLKKTWIRIRQDDPTAEPVFDDIVYPKVGSLKLKGTRFWVEIREANAVTIRKNGQTLAYQPPGIAIQ